MAEGGRVKRDLLIETESGNKLTLKQKRFVDEYIKNGGKRGGADAIIKAGYKVKDKIVASSMATEYLNKPYVKEEVRAVLTKHKMSADDLSKRLRRSIDSGLGKKPTNSDALRGIEMGFRLLDAFPVERKQIEQHTLNLSLSGKSLDELSAKLDDLMLEAQQMREKIASKDVV